MKKVKVVLLTTIILAILTGCARVEIFDFVVSSTGNDANTGPE